MSDEKINFTCEHCGADISAGRGLHGIPVPCPECGESNKVPFVPDKEMLTDKENRETQTNILTAFIRSTEAQRKIEEQEQEPAVHIPTKKHVFVAPPRHPVLPVPPVPPPEDDGDIGGILRYKKAIIFVSVVTLLIVITSTIAVLTVSKKTADSNLPETPAVVENPTQAVIPNANLKPEPQVEGQKEVVASPVNPEKGKTVTETTVKPKETVKPVPAPTTKQPKTVAKEAQPKAVQNPREIQKIIDTAGDDIVKADFKSAAEKLNTLKDKSKFTNEIHACEVAADPNKYVLQSFSDDKDKGKEIKMRLGDRKATVKILEVTGEDIKSLEKTDKGMIQFNFALKDITKEEKIARINRQSKASLTLIAIGEMVQKKDYAKASSLAVETGQLSDSILKSLDKLTAKDKKGKK
ncbi:MAG TPA: hypothetical protein DCZ94_04920 [Lentisphaeria bacterium]|nr:MAG: hypothetical protein A2X48_07890 [Lentisphaerae bacterium GWF2_49_21]HBC86279.1 hypothetical protein [Lentisphaeria bacterium]